MSSWTFGRKVSAGFAIAVLALVVVGVTGYRNTTALIANDELVAHSHLVRRKLADVQAQIVNVETGQRGFTLTGREEFLDPYKSGLVDLEKAYSELRQLLSDNPVQLRRLEELRAPIDGKLAHIKAAIDLRRSGGIEPVIAKISAGDGKNFMDQVRNGIDLLDFEESTLLANRAKAAEASAELTTSVIAWGTVAAIVLIILAAWLIISSLTKQIGTAVRHIQSSSTELQAAANQQASGSREQSTAMTEIATTINELQLLVAEERENPQGVGGPPVRLVTVENDGGVRRDAVAAAELGEFLGAHIVAHHLIVQVTAPVDMYCPGDMARIIKEHVFIALHDADVRVVQVSGKPFRIHEHVGIGVGGKFRIHGVFSWVGRAKVGRSTCVTPPRKQGE